MSKKDKVPTEAGETQLSEEELSQAQGGGNTFNKATPLLFPAGTGGLDLTSNTGLKGLADLQQKVQKVRKP